MLLWLLSATNSDYHIAFRQNSRHSTFFSSADPYIYAELYRLKYWFLNTIYGE